MDSARVTGVITVLRPTKAFGFIKAVGQSSLVYFDLSDIQTPKTGLNSPVTFILEPSPGRTHGRAVDIRKAA